MTETYPTYTGDDAGQTARAKRRKRTSEQLIAARQAELEDLQRRVAKRSCRGAERAIEHLQSVIDDPAAIQHLKQACGEALSIVKGALPYA